MFAAIISLIAIDEAGNPIMDSEGKPFVVIDVGSLPLAFLRMMDPAATVDDHIAIAAVDRPGMIEAFATGAPKKLASLKDRVEFYAEAKVLKIENPDMNPADLGQKAMEVIRTRNPSNNFVNALFESMAKPTPDEEPVYDVDLTVERPADMNSTPDVDIDVE